MHDGRRHVLTKERLRVYVRSFHLCALQKQQGDRQKREIGFDSSALLMGPFLVMSVASLGKRACFGQDLMYACTRLNNVGLFTLRRRDLQR